MCEAIFSELHSVACGSCIAHRSSFSSLWNSSLPCFAAPRARTTATLRVDAAHRVPSDVFHRFNAMHQASPAPH